MVQTVATAVNRKPLLIDYRPLDITARRSLATLPMPGDGPGTPNSTRADLATVPSVWGITRNGLAGSPVSAEIALPSSGFIFVLQVRVGTEGYQPFLLWNNRVGSTC